MRYGHIIQAIYETPWAIMPTKLTEILTLIDLKLDGVTLSAEDIAARIGPPRSGTASGPPAVAVLPLLGVISQRQNLMSETSGGTSIERFQTAFRAAIADPAVKAIVLDVDSPGGAVSGVMEMADEVYSARRQKPVYAVANTLAASAAYWIASAATEFYASPSADVGSIGVIAAHQDVSRSMEARGVKTSFVTAGRYKAEGNSYEPLGEEARAEIQRRVDEAYGSFTRAVARHRGVEVATVRGEQFGEGRVYSATEATKRQMIDGVATLDKVVSRALTAIGPQPRGVGADVHRAKLRILAS